MERVGCTGPRRLKARLGEPDEIRLGRARRAAPHRRIRAARHRAGAGVARLYDPPARPRSQAGAARRRQHLAEGARRAIWPATRSTSSMSKAPAGTWAAIEPAGFPAVRLDPLRALRARDALSDDDFVRVQQRLPPRSAGARRLRSRCCCMPSCRRLHRPHPRHRGAEHRRPARRRGLVRRGLRRPARLRALFAARLRPGAGSPRVPSTRTQRSKA